MTIFGRFYFNQNAVVYLLKRLQINKFINPKINIHEKNNLKCSIRVKC